MDKTELLLVLFKYIKVYPVIQIGGRLQEARTRYDAAKKQT